MVTCIRLIIATIKLADHAITDESSGRELMPIVMPYLDGTYKRWKSAIPAVKG